MFRFSHHCPQFAKVPDLCAAAKNIINKQSTDTDVWKPGWEEPG